MGNTHDTEIARIEADFIHTKYRTNEDYRWGYTNERGPETWWIYYPSASGGMQSPIDIQTEEVLWDPELTHNKLQICYSRPARPPSSDDEDQEGGASGGKETLTLVNTGNTARINIGNASSYICGGPCRDHSFVLEQIHLHWGEDDGEGSEHLINSHTFAAELHLVHWNEDLYDSYEEAVKREDGIVIIAVFVKISEERSNRGLLCMADVVEDIAYREQSASLSSSLETKAFLPEDTSKYWTYKGSFTTPPCFETVTWIIMQESIPVTSRTLSRFRELKSYCENEVRPDEEFDGLIGRNCRPLQPAGTRRIYTSEDHHHDHHHMIAGEDDPFRTSAVARGSAFPECGVVVLRQCGRA